MPQAVKVATLWYKPGSRRVEREPDFFVHETDNWLVLPYELTGLTQAELQRHKPVAFELMAPHGPSS